jgi:hypothetical protein
VGEQLGFEAFYAAAYRDRRPATAAGDRRAAGGVPADRGRPDLYSQGAVRVTSIEIGDQVPADMAGAYNGAAW